MGGKASSLGTGAPCTDPEPSLSWLMLVLADAPVQLDCEYAGEIGLRRGRSGSAALWPVPLRGDPSAEDSELC